MALVDLSDPKARAEALEQEKHVERIRREARHAVKTEPLPLGDVPTLTGYTLDDLRTVSLPTRRPLLVRNDMPVLCEGHIGQVHGLRGLGKTWFVQTLALVAATGVEAFGFRNPNEALSKVLYIDGEMSGEDIQERLHRLCRVMHVPDAKMSNLTFVGADWQPQFLPRLDTPEGQAAIEPFVDRAGLLFVDNRSCLFNPEGEKDPTAWQPAQDWLLDLRRRGKAVVTVHHANRQGGARGHSKPEDVANVLIKLSRPEDYSAEAGARFIVEFEKSRGFWGSAAAPFIATLTPNGWTVDPVDSEQEDPAMAKLREYLVEAHRTGARPTSATTAIDGAHINRPKGLKAWRELKESGELVAHPEGGFYLNPTMDDGLPM